MEPKVLIGYITNEYARRADFYDYLNMLDYPPNSTILPSHNASPAAARNKLIQTAIDEQFDKIVLIDDDHKFKPDTLKRLLAHDLDIVTALYVQRAWPHKPLVFDLVTPENEALYSYLEDPPKLREVQNAGMGFCVFNVSVFSKMEKPWFRLGELKGAEDQWCDDIGFFIRAKQAGFKIFVDETVTIGHLGTMVVTPIWDEKLGKWYIGYNTDYETEIRVPVSIPVNKYEFAK